MPSGDEDIHVDQTLHDSRVYAEGRLAAFIEMALATGSEHVIQEGQDTLFTHHRVHLGLATRLDCCDVRALHGLGIP